jgi:hypothetical protein
MQTRGLDELEAVVVGGRQTFLDVGEALLEINERRLYRQTHPTFAAYCEQRLGFSRDYGYKMMRAAAAVLGGDVDSCLQTEGAVRSALRREPPHEFPEYDESLPTEFECPMCGYRWSGKAVRQGRSRARQYSSTAHLTD